MSLISPSRLRLGLTVLAVLTGLVGSVALVETAAVTATPELIPGTAAMRIAIDPDTGELVPARIPMAKAMDAELAEMLSTSTVGLVEVHHPDGHVYVDLQGRFMNASLARIGSDGLIEATCVESTEQAESFLSGGGTQDRPWEVQ